MSLIVDPWKERSFHSRVASSEEDNERDLSLCAECESEETRILKRVLTVDRIPARSAA